MTPGNRQVRMLRFNCVSTIRQDRPADEAIVGMKINYGLHD